MIGLITITILLVVCFIVSCVVFGEGEGFGVLGMLVFGSLLYLCILAFIAHYEKVNEEETYKKALFNNPYEYYILKDSTGQARDTIYEFKKK